MLHIPNSDHPVCLKDDPGSGGESSGLLLSTTEPGNLLQIVGKHFVRGKRNQISLTPFIASRYCKPLICVQLCFICICIICPKWQMDLSKLENVFVKIEKYMCPNCRIVGHIVLVLSKSSWFPLVLVLLFSLLNCWPLVDGGWTKCYYGAGRQHIMILPLWRPD